jgi:hypothetical protein
MKTYLTWKPALVALMGVVALASVGLASNADGRGAAAVSATVEATDCNSRDPLSACFDPRLGYTQVGDLYIVDDSF